MLLPELPATPTEPSLSWEHPSVRLKDLEETPSYHHKRHSQAKDIK